jgi:hypothetical protein
MTRRSSANRWRSNISRRSTTPGSSSGGSILDLFADDAQVFFPKWGLATGKTKIGQLFSDFGGGIKHILDDYAPSTGS